SRAKSPAAAPRASQANSACHRRGAPVTEPAMPAPEVLSHAYLGPADAQATHPAVSALLELPGDDLRAGSPGRAPRAQGCVGWLAAAGGVRGDGWPGDQRVTDRRRGRWRRLSARDRAYRPGGPGGRRVLHGRRGVRLGLLAERADPCR